MKRVLFVCTGNTCRSPMAEHLFRYKVDQEGLQVETQSAGVVAMNGSAASAYVAELLSEKGIDFSHSSQPVTEKLIDWADMVLAMSLSHQQMLLGQFPHKGDHIYTLKGYLHPDLEDVDIDDPIGGDRKRYEQMMLELDQVLDDLVKRLK